MEKVTDKSDADKSGSFEPLSENELEQMPADVRQRVQELNMYLITVQQRLDNAQGEVRASDERAKAQQCEWQQRERMLLRRLTAKEHEMQDAAVQISELKSAQAQRPNACNLIDPAMNVILQKLRAELAQTQQRLDDTQNELSAWKFTPDSNTGKRLMAKCRLLYTENEELGKLTSSGRIAKLESELALQKSFSDEVKKSQSELDEFLQDLDEDVEGMQSTIYYLQQELLKSKQTIESLQEELRVSRPHVTSVNYAQEETTESSNMDSIRDRDQVSDAYYHATLKSRILAKNSDSCDSSGVACTLVTNDCDASANHVNSDTTPPANHIIINNNKRTYDQCDDVGDTFVTKSVDNGQSECVTQTKKRIFVNGQVHA